MVKSVEHVFMAYSDAELTVSRCEYRVEIVFLFCFVFLYWVLRIKPKIRAIFDNCLFLSVDSSVSCIM